MASEMPSAKKNFKVLIADDDGPIGRKLGDYLSERGFGVDIVSNGRAARDFISVARPFFIICDLTLAEFNAPQILTWLKEPQFLDYRPKVFVTSAHNSIQNIKECLKLGASDYVLKPVKNEDILTRLIFHIQSKRDLVTEAKTNKDRLDGIDLYLNLLDVVLREALSGRAQDDVLFNINKMIAITLKAVRCSVVFISEDRQVGEVRASSDDRGVRGLLLDMNKYPEMVHVMNSEKTVVIEDLAYDPQLAQIKDKVKGISFNSMIVCPLRRNNDMCGVVSARMDRNHSKFNEKDIRFVQLVTQILSVLLTTPSFMPHEFSKSG